MVTQHWQRALPTEVNTLRSGDPTFYFPDQMQVGSALPLPIV